MGKFYAVLNGKKAGIFTSWEETKPLVDGFAGAVYKSFKTREEAEAYMRGESEETVAGLCAYVDGSFDPETGRYAYGVVILEDGKEKEKLSGTGDDSEAASMRNVAGELKGAMIAMRYALKNGYDKITVYHDYAGISEWALKKWKTNLESTRAYAGFFDKISKELKVEFIKVAAHTGVKYNEMADKLAKEALK